MFFINYLDRTAIGFAAPNGMNQDLALSAAQFGFASGVFFVGYLILEIPSNLALHKFGARVWLARIMITWGIVAVLFTWVQSFTQLAGLRFLLGVAEAGFFPGAILFLSTWVPARYRGQILMLFYLAQPLTTVVGAPLAGLLIQQHGVFGLEGWRFMFLGVGIPAIIVGILCLFVLKDKPQQVTWLNHDEKEWLTAELAAEGVGQTGDEKRVPARHAFRSGRVWVLALIYFGFIYGLYALAFFLPDDHRGLPGADRHGTRDPGTGPDHRDPVPACGHRHVLLVAQRDQARAEDLAHRGAGRWWEASPSRSRCCRTRPS
jgi:MFS family permease